MVSAETVELINEFLGGMHALTSSLGRVLEQALLEEVAGTQITVSQLRLLKLVARAESQTIGDVANFLGISNAAASKAADRLVRRKLIRRTEGASDRRSIELSLTEAGRRLVAQYDAARNKRIEKVFRQFPVEDLHHTARLMERVAVAIVGHSPNPDEVCLQCKMYLREKCLLRDISRHDCLYIRSRSRGEARAKAAPVTIAPAAKRNGENEAVPRRAPL
ncbi:MAG: MarR family transcriptional regulator [Bryobacterales bacterium]|nr:MarR family transcriptional regulator [Bryobacterales bacterium]